MARDIGSTRGEIKDAVADLGQKSAIAKALFKVVVAIVLGIVVIVIVYKLSSFSDEFKIRWNMERQVTAEIDERSHESKKVETGQPGEVIYQEYFKPRIITLTKDWSEKFMFMGKRIEGRPITPDVYYRIRVNGDDRTISTNLPPQNIKEDVYYEIPKGAQYVQVQIAPGQKFVKSEFRIYWTEPKLVPYQHIEVTPGVQITEN